MFIRFARAKVAQTFVSLLLLASLLTAFSPQSVPTAQAAPGDPVLTPPPTYYRPDSTNFVAGTNDPINLILYGRNLTAANVKALLESTTTDRGAWRNQDGVYPCISKISWNPLVGQTPVNQLGASADTNCNESQRLGVQTDSPTRAHVRYWEYIDTVNQINTVYVAASAEENYLRLNQVCGRVLGVFSAHCLLNYNEARDQTITSLNNGVVVGSQGFRILREKNKITSFTWNSIQPRPSANDANPIQPFSSDGTRVYCLERDVNSTYCNGTPAERSISISSVTPARGSQLEIGTRFNYTFNVGYSDLNRRFSGSGALLKMTYKTAATSSLTATIGSSPRVSSPGAGNYSFAFSNVAIPNAWVDPVSNTSEAFVEIQVTDSASLVWKYSNLRYILTRTQYDFVFLVDTSGSMAGNLASANAPLTGLVNDLTRSYPTAQFGLAEFNCCSAEGYGRKTDLSVATNTTSAIANLGVNSGCCGAPYEANFNALKLAVSGSSAQKFTWRPNARRMIFLVTDTLATPFVGSGSIPLSEAVSALNLNNTELIGLYVANGNHPESALIAEMSSLTNATTGTNTRRTNGSPAVFSLYSFTLANIQDVLTGTYR